MEKATEEMTAEELLADSIAKASSGEISREEYRRRYDTYCARLKAENSAAAGKPAV